MNTSVVINPAQLAERKVMIKQISLSDRTGGPARNMELDSMILMGPSQNNIPLFYFLPDF